MTDDDPERTPDPAIPDGSGTDRRNIELWLRESLRRDALRTAARLDDLAKRVEREAPTFSPRLRAALEALQLLSGRLSLDVPPEASARAADGPAPTRVDRCNCAACIYLDRSRSVASGPDAGTDPSRDEVF